MLEQTSITRQRSRTVESIYGSAQLKDVATRDTSRQTGVHPSVQDGLPLSNFSESKESAGSIEFGTIIRGA